MSAPADLDWTESETPVSRRFGDPYFSQADGLAEARHTFLGGNDLPERLADTFVIAELGFGTGLNLLAAARAWAGTGRPGTVHFFSFEADPLSETDAARALARFPSLADLTQRLLGQWDSLGARAVALPGLTASVILGDARQTLPAWPGRADAWFLDGFAPARNPELWEPALMAEVARHTRPGGTAATYSAAGHVRRALAAAGFAVERVPGFGRKRHMTRARLP